MKTISIQGRSPEDIRQALQQSLSSGFTPTLAMVFLSVEQDIGSISGIFDKAGIQVFGATTSGEFINGETGSGGIAAMLLDAREDNFRIAFLERGERSLPDISRQLGMEGKKHFSNAAFLIASSGIMADGEEIIKGIEEGFGSSAAIYGGMAGDDMIMKDTFVFTNRSITSQGLVAIIIDNDKIEVNGVAACGWKPVGIAKTITGSAGKYLYTLDGEPALDLIIKYLGLKLEDMQENQGMVNIGTGTYYPLQLERENAPPVMRNAVWGNLKDRSILCAGNMPQGAKVRFSLPPDFSIINTAEKECASLRVEKQQEADAVIMFSCITRYLSLGIMINDEIENVMKVWKAPFIGFFTYGEFGKSTGGRNEFHNNTCCVVILKEK